MIHGNTSGIKQYILDEMEQVYTHVCGRNEFISPLLIDFLTKYTALLGREISIYLSRAGRVLDVSIGDSDHVDLPYVRKRRGVQGLSGVRCIHTHPGGSSQLSSVDIGTLLSSRLDAMAALAATRPLVAKLMKTDIKPTNADRVLGGLARVTERIDNDVPTGAVYIDGKTWSARSSTGEIIEPDAMVRVIRMEGVKLYVEKEA